MEQTLKLQHRITTQAEPTDRAMRIAVMFGLTLDETREHVVIPPIELTLKPGQIVFVTGVSGGGKSTLLRLITEAIVQRQSGDASVSSPALICSHILPTLRDTALVDALAVPEVNEIDAASSADLEDVCHWLSRAGLNDAAVMLRRPLELSEGQRHRLRLAQAIAIAERRPETWSVILADEFGSNLDRTTAYAVARSTRRWVADSQICFVAATAHDDLLEPMQPDVLVEVSPGGLAEVHTRTAQA